MACLAAVKYPVTQEMNFPRNCAQAVLAQQRQKRAFSAAEH